MNFDQIVLLASASQRRKDLLGNLLESFEVFVPNMDEEEFWESKDVTKENVDAFLVELALAKAHSVSSMMKKGKVIGADTVAMIDGQMVGKPLDESDAVGILTRMSGKKHEVKTAVAIVDCDTGKEHAFCETSSVEFKELTEQEIRDYVDSGEAMGKAGAYAIQEKGDLFVKEISGSFSNIVGLPIESLGETLKTFGVKVKELQK